MVGKRSHKQALLVLVLAGWATGCVPERNQMAPVTGIAKKQQSSTAPATTVVIDNFTFGPPMLTVAAGTRVTWINHDDVPHTVTSTVKPRVLDSGTLETDDRYSYTFTTPGTYPYYCMVHTHMTGTVIVK